MKTRHFALLFVIATSFTFAEATLQPVNVLGGAIRNPQALALTEPTPLTDIVEKCGGLLNIWSGIVTISKKESDVLVTIRRYQFQKRPTGAERAKIFSGIIIFPGEVVNFQEIYD